MSESVQVGIHVVAAVACLSLAALLLLVRRRLLEFHARRGHDTSERPWSLLGWVMLLLGTTQGLTAVVELAR